MHYTGSGVNENHVVVPDDQLMTSLARHKNFTAGVTYDYGVIIFRAPCLAQLPNVLLSSMSQLLTFTEKWTVLH